MRSLYCIYFTVAGWRTSFIIGLLVQWVSPKAIVWLALPISKKSSKNKVLGKRLLTIFSTFGDDASLSSSVTTLWGCGNFWDSMTLDRDDGLIWVCNLIWWLFLAGYMSTSCNRYAGCLFSAAFGNVAVAWTGGLLIYFLNMAANVVNSVILSNPIMEKGTSACRCFKALVMYWSAIRSRSVE